MTRFSRRLLFSAALLVASGMADAGAASLRPDPAPVPDTYFGMHIHRAVGSTPWPAVPFGAWRMWDTGTTWRDLEPAKGHWNFTRLDRQVALAEARHADILVTLAGTPAWASARPNEAPADRPGDAAEPADMQDWRDFVRTVAMRYKGRIHCYEIWNEPNVRHFYTGDVKTMVGLTAEAYKILHAVDPSVTVVSPPATGGPGVSWLSAFLQAGGGDDADVIGFHFYVDGQPPEAMVKTIQAVGALMAQYNIRKPLWNTESGWHKPDPFPDALAPAYVARAYILNRAAGVSRFYWYAWDNLNWVTLTMTERDSATLRPAAAAYTATEQWLTGAVLDSCNSDASGVWICRLSRGGAPSWIVWRESGEGQFTVPAGWNVRQARSALNSEVPAAPGMQLAIGPLPQLLF